MYLSLLRVNVDNRRGKQWLGSTYRIHQRLWMAFPDSERRQDDPFFLGTWDGPPLAEPKPERRDAGFLFRIEHDGHPRILVQSVQKPDWEYAFQNAPHLLADEPRTREFDPTPRRDDAYRFRLLANVVYPKSVPHPDGRMRTTRSGLTIRRRKRTEIPVFPRPIPDALPTDPAERQQVLFARWDPWRQWLNRVAKDRGFRVIDEVGEREPSLLMEAVHTVVRNPARGRDASHQDKPTRKRYNAGLFEGMLVCTDPDQLRDAIINGIGHGKAFGFGLLSIAPAK
ncbi:type I-E CRISPR-associated protein Cas6/Cse3/CasE [Anaerobaca lacustris]|uniref:Type I-E CRISPR-associated protein Cas6/Cse3/CasE n=1 Tax=Anaerobaca lacustris TaxID=3044600 RepID=A0AAW6U0Z5_9BACT|nr:type I-E CRISPR-associated protein Cas6/Cse3/CasE [Sedimentisphaerales bacterium M17dextr]